MYISAWLSYFLFLIYLVCLPVLFVRRFAQGFCETGALLFARWRVYGALDERLVLDDPRFLSAGLSVQQTCDAAAVLFLVCCPFARLGGWFGARAL